MSENVLYDVADRIATITLNRPEKLNAWTGPMAAQYFDALDEAHGDPEVRAIIVTGAGRGFSAGADMGGLQATSEGGSTRSTELRSEHQTYTLGIRKPVVAAINGACAGIGLVQAVMADVRFAAAGAKFTTAFARRGLIAEHGIGYILPKLVGPSNALDLLMSGRVIVAEEAQELGLVNRVYPADELMDQTRAYVSDIADNVAPSSIAVMKEQVWDSIKENMAMAESNAFADKAMHFSLGQPDFKEGVASFVEKRAPNFAPFTP